MALGARADLVGRPLFWGLAINGETGVRQMLEILRVEFDRAMAYCGRTSVAQIDASLATLPCQCWTGMNSPVSTGQRPAGVAGVGHTHFSPP
ncbi:MAG: alpha-hydroxy-acid oxidizing protein [Chloroflexi bacterium]|nr:alpha-hydroxy-acid oxidizing protein [Chloroflexota bacterium]